LMFKLGMGKGLSTLDDLLRSVRRFRAASQI
jgi:hypothetical protein